MGANMNIDTDKKDGYCHLWEKRNVTDDDYPERWEA